jgi:ubiquinone/menaquinone biosynthesis C-methylase UbiE
MPLFAFQNHFMKWYDVFSRFYDTALEKLYFSGRQKATQLLQLDNATTVLDIACGTGANFSHIKAINPGIIIYATDYSEGMLAKARKRIEKHGWENMMLFQADACSITPQALHLSVGQSNFDRIICTLGLSVIPHWEKVLENLLALLKEDGIIVIMDVYAEKRTINSWLVEKMAKAELNRQIAQALQNRTCSFQIEYLPISERKLGGKLFVAAGSKKRESLKCI